MMDTDGMFSVRLDWESPTSSSVNAADSGQLESLPAVGVRDGIKHV